MAVAVRCGAGAGAGAGGGAGTLVVLDDQGRVIDSIHGLGLPEVASNVARMTGEDPFLLGIDIPVVVGSKPVRLRPVDSQIKKRFGFKLPPGGRAALAAEPSGVGGEALLAGLGAAGHPSLPFPDRDRRRPGMLETYPTLILKMLVWIDSQLGEVPDPADQRTLFQSYATPVYRLARMGARTSWGDQASALDQAMRLIETIHGFDQLPAREALIRARDSVDVERAAALFDASLIAGMARRYVDDPESCLFLGDTESGYIVLPANPFIRSLASDTQPTHGRLFPTASLRRRLGAGVTIRAADLIDIPGRPHRLEARFDAPPRYEFDNVDEMMWWKHARHRGGPRLPIEGLTQMVVALDGSRDDVTLHLVRSRHRTLSFRFDPPAAWRHRVAMRDGKTYAFEILQATYETRPD